MKQMKIKFLSIALLLVGVAMFSTSCEKNEPKNPKEEEKKDNSTTYMLSRKTGYSNDWIYFSFSTGKEVTGITEKNKTERLDWDIAFNVNNMRTNSGKSGKGKGGAIALKETDLSKVATVPTTGYEVDKDIHIIKALSSMPPPMMKSTGNQVLAKAITFSGPPPRYTIQKNVFVIKTADGKYAKVKFTNFYNKEGKSGYVSFKYVYQADGSANF